MDENKNALSENEIEEITSTTSKEKLHTTSKKKAKRKRSKLTENKHAVDEDEVLAKVATDSVEHNAIQYVMDMSSSDKATQLQGSRGIRQLLCTEEVPPISECIKIGVVPLCVNFLKKKGRSELKYEAAWILTNISGGNAECTRKVIDEGALEPLYALLESSKEDLVKQCCWAITNCISDSVEVRDSLFTKGLIECLESIVKKFKTERELLHTVAWCLSVAFRGCRSEIYDTVIPKTIPMLATLLSKKDGETVVCSLWALSFIIFIGDSDEDEDLVEKIFVSVEHYDILPKVIKYLGSDVSEYVYPCLRIVGNIVSGPDRQTSIIVEMDVLKHLCSALQNKRVSIVKEAAWIVSNISAGTFPQVDAVVKSGAIPLLISVIYKSEFRAKKEAIWAIANITTGGNSNHILTLYKAGAITCLCNALSLSDWNTLLVVFEALENILKASVNIGIAHVERFRSQVDECGGFDKVFELQYHENETVHLKAFSFINDFYSEKTALAITNNNIGKKSVYEMRTQF